MPLMQFLNTVHTWISLLQLCMIVCYANSSERGRWATGLVEGGAKYPLYTPPPPPKRSNSCFLSKNKCEIECFRVSLSPEFVKCKNTIYQDAFKS